MVDTRLITKLMAPLKRRVVSMVSRAVVNLINDSGDMQVLQVTTLADKVADDVEHFEAYGFTSSPPSGSEAIVLHIGGNQDHPVAIIVTNRGTRFAGLSTKDSAMYTDDGNRVHCKSADGSIAAVPTSAGLVHLGADAAAQFVALAADVLAELNSIKTDFDSHTHSYLPGPGAATPTATPLPLLTAPSSVAATKVKAT